MTIVLNGQSRETTDNITVADLLNELDLAPQRVAVEVNRKLVPRDFHDKHVLCDGDRLEVVSLVGGG